MLRIIETIMEKDGWISVKVQGRLVGRSVRVLATECRPIVEQPERVELDLGGVSYADVSGVAMLHDLTAPGVRIVNVTPFLQELLRGDTAR